MLSRECDMKEVIKNYDIKWNRKFSEQKLKIRKLFLRIFLGIEFKGNQVVHAQTLLEVSW